MLTVIIPLVLLFAIILIRRIPWIGGNIEAALLISGISMALLAGLRPWEYVEATADGLDRMAWVIALSFFGALYAETQVRLGSIDTTMDLLRKVFGNSPRGLIAATFITLVIGASLLGDAIATATVIGLLVIHSLAAMGVKPVQIGMIILLGASLGSIMPPVSQAIVLSASLVETDVVPVIRVAFLTVGVGVVLAILESFRFVKKRRAVDAEQGSITGLAPVPPVGTLLRTRGYTLLPMLVLLIIVLLNTAWEIDLFALIPGVSHAVAALAEVPVLSGLANSIVLAIIVATFVAFCFPSVHAMPINTVAEGTKKVGRTIRLQLCAGVLVGMVYASGVVETIAEAAAGMQGEAITVGGIIALIVIGMLTGSQTASQTIVVPFMAPLLEQLGVDPFNIALGASHIAAGGQNFPPVGLTAFVVSGLVGGTLNTKVDPVKVMLLALPNSIYIVTVGAIALFI